MWYVMCATCAGSSICEKKKGVEICDGGIFLGGAFRGNHHDNVGASAAGLRRGGSWMLSHGSDGVRCVRGVVVRIHSLLSSCSEHAHDHVVLPKETLSLGFGPESEREVEALHQVMKTYTHHIDRGN